MQAQAPTIGPRQPVMLDHILCDTFALDLRRRQDGWVSYRFSAETLDARSAPRSRPATIVRWASMCARAVNEWKACRRTGVGAEDVVHGSILRGQIPGAEQTVADALREDHVPELGREAVTDRDQRDARAPDRDHPLPPLRNQRPVCQLTMAMVHDGFTKECSRWVHEPRVSKAWRAHDGV